MKMILYVGVGGFFGAIARYLLSGLAHRLSGGTVFPVGTLTVNVLGCLIIGALMSLIVDKAVLGPSVRMVCVVGFLGAFTTFSSFGYETLGLLRDGQMLSACLNVLANVVLGIGAVFLGWALVRGVTA